MIGIGIGILEFNGAGCGCWDNHVACNAERLDLGVVSTGHQRLAVQISEIEDVGKLLKGVGSWQEINIRIYKR